jgi:hypothetical protein
MHATAARHYLQAGAVPPVPASNVAFARLYMRGRRWPVLSPGRGENGLRDANMVHGTPVIFAGGRLQAAGDDDEPVHG